MSLMWPILDSCCFCWQDKDGNLSNGAIANLVDVAGASLIYVTGLPMNVSVDMSISYVSKAKIGVSKLPLKIIYILHFSFTFIWFLATSELAIPYMFNPTYFRAQNSLEIWVQWIRNISLRVSIRRIWLL